MSARLWSLQASRYLLVGALNTLVGLLVIVALQALLGVSPYVANACGYGVGMVVGFLANRSWTFRHSGPVALSATLYAAMFTICYSLNLAVLWLALNVLGWPAALAQLAAMAAYTVCFFVGCKMVVFARG
jgi:putative flippase GtrA